MCINLDFNAVIRITSRINDRNAMEPFAAEALYKSIERNNFLRTVVVLSRVSSAVLRQRLRTESVQSPGQVLQNTDYCPQSHNTHSRMLVPCTENKMANRTNDMLYDLL